MKIIVSVLLLFLSCAFLAGCAQNSAEPPDNSVDVVDVIDVDLSALSITMVYAELNNILNNPNAYAGKRIKMGGPYYSVDSPESGQRNHYVAVEVADSCCVMGLEFTWDGEDAFPNGYPGEWEQIEVTGLYKSETEQLSGAYSFLVVEELRVLS